MSELAKDFLYYLKKFKKATHLLDRRPEYFKQDEFLYRLNMTFTDYMLALRSSIKRITVFYKRTSYDIVMNTYNEEILYLHHGNMDIQFIPDPYGLVAYLTSYIMKTNSVISRVLDLTVHEINRGK